VVSYSLIYKTEKNKKTKQKKEKIDKFVISILGVEITDVKSKEHCSFRVFGSKGKAAVLFA